MKSLFKILGTILAVVFIFNVNQAKSQDIIVGAKTGLNYSTIALDYFDSYNLKRGWNFAIYGEYSLNEILGMPLAVSLELHYLKYGADNIEPTLVYSPDSPLLTTTPIENSHFYFNSMDFPLLVKYDLPFVEFLSPDVYLGASYNYIFSTYNENYFTEDRFAEANISERIRQYNISGLVGLGASMDIGPVAITADLRYQMGLRDMNNVVNHPDFTSHSLQLMAGVAYYISGSGE